MKCRGYFAGLFPLVLALWCVGCGDDGGGDDGGVRTLRQFVNQRASDGCSALILASAVGDVSCVRLLIEEGENLRALKERCLLYTSDAADE